jgi:tRNA A-37 threonylcarbamoyl transferase component Bud32
MNVSPVPLEPTLNHCGQCDRWVPVSATACENDDCPLEKLVPALQERAKKVPEFAKALLNNTIDKRYRIDEFRGQGGMGAVFRAFHVVTRRPCAVKLLQPELKGKSAEVDRFLNEAATVASLESKHTVRVYDAGSLPDGSLFIAMEWLDGRTLKEVLAEVGALPWPAAVEVAKQVCASLSEAHERHLVHRDIKPDNIMLMGELSAPLVKVLDFGVAKSIHPTAEPGLTRRGLAVGTPTYLSPEALRAQPVDGRADLYALGVVMWELLVGRPPFRGATQAETLASHLRDSPEPPSRAAPQAKIPRWLDEAVLACLAKDPMLRPNGAGALLELLERGGARRSASGWLWLGAGAAVVVAGVGLGFAGTDRGSSPTDLVPRKPTLPAPARSRVEVASERRERQGLDSLQVAGGAGYPDLREANGNADFRSRRPYEEEVPKAPRGASDRPGALPR